MTYTRTTCCGGAFMGSSVCPRLETARGLRRRPGVGLSKEKNEASLRGLDSGGSGKRECVMPLSRQNRDAPKLLNRPTTKRGVRFKAEARRARSARRSGLKE